MILGVDLGQKTTGLAISGGEIAKPHKTVTHKNLNQALTKLIAIIEAEDVDTVVIGFVEGKTKRQFTKFAALLKTARPDLKVTLWDETLTSRQAIETMVKLGIAKRRRGQKQHEYAAALILQSYLDSNEYN